MDLPQEVINEIKANRKIEAIKQLREARGIGLKEAKESVDAYIEREAPKMTSAPRSGGDHKLFLLAVAIVVAYLAYRFLG